MSYIRNLLNALRGKPVVQIKVVTQKVPEIHWKIKKDPNGLVQNDLLKIRSLMNTKPYKVGDPIELVATKAAEERLYQAIVKHIVAAKVSTF